MSGLVAARTTIAWERYAGVAGIVFVIALLGESVIATGVGLTQNDSAAKIAAGLHEHRDRELAIAYLSAVYAATFVIYLCSLYTVLRREAEPARILGYLVLVGGALFVALHAVSDIGITGLLGAKLASFGYQHDQSLDYTLYLLTYALDSVGDVFGSLAAVAAGLLVMGAAFCRAGLDGYRFSPGSCSSCKVSASAASSQPSGWFWTSSPSCCS